MNTKNALADVAFLHARIPARTSRGGNYAPRSTGSVTVVRTNTDTWVKDNGHGNKFVKSS